MKIFELAQANPHLRFIDTLEDRQYSLDELPLVSIPGEKKELVFLYLDNSIGSISVFWSFMRSAHCVALLAPNLAANFKAELENLYQPRFVYDPTRSGIEGFDDLASATQQVFVNRTVLAGVIHPANKLLISTSGSTGSPKFVKLSEENLVANAVAISEYLPINGNDVTPLNLPVYYSYGLSVLTTNAIKGGKIVCTKEDVLKKEFWNQLARYGYTSIAGVPFVYEMLDRIGFTTKTYPSLRYLTQAGGKLQENFVRKYADYAAENNILFYVMYGQTEATARMSYLPPERLAEKVGSIGIAIPGGRFEIDEDSSELCYSGPNVFGGYANCPEDLASYSNESRLKTGDIATRDEEGFYYITGRLKRFVKLFGSRVNLDEVESLIAKKFSIAAKCVGLNDKILAVFLTGNDDQGEPIRAFLSEELSIHISVIKVKYIDEIPLTVNGKVDYGRLTAVYGDR